MRKIIFELCAETIDACIAAREGGAHRIELCSALDQGGLTPSHGLVRAAVEQSAIPVHAMIRPRGGDFIYTDAELALMKDDIEHIKTLGVAGIVLGVLRNDGTVDSDTTRSFVELASPMKVTFHRAFDSAPLLEEALEQVIAIGCDRILTSGGQRTVKAGAETLARLVIQANERIDIALGGGLRLQTAASVACVTNAKHFHGSLRRKLSVEHSAHLAASDTTESNGNGHRYIVHAEDVRAIVQRLQSA